MEYKYYKEVTGELVRVHIEQDTTPENPRYDWDGNIGHMMCWHRNYQLGDYKENSYSDNLDFLNTHPFLVTFVMGIVLSLEQNKADTATIRSVRISAAGPLGGIGDALFWLTLVPITAGLTANMAMEGQIIGAVLFLIIFNAVQFAVRFGLMYWSYGLGTKAVTLLTSSAKEFTRAASILGIFVVGGLIANYGGTSLRIVVGDPAINIQGLLDGVLPKLIPLLITLGIYVLIKKGWTPVKCIILILVVGILGCAFGIWTGDSKAMDADGNTIPGGYTPLVEWYQLPEEPAE